VPRRADRHDGPKNGPQRTRGVEHVDAVRRDGPRRATC
jgi:hypothetical protein